jgi:signal transduction histidine kinase
MVATNLGGLPSVLGDPEQIRIVFGNLIRNAREAMPQGGHLTLTARQVDGHVEVDVTDTGVGIAPDAVARVMEPLYSTKARGLGLGLAIARAIVEKHGGGLRVRSELGKGTTFTVRLTAVREESPQEGKGAS